MATPFIWDVERSIISFGSLELRWYSLLFALSILLGYFIVQAIWKHEGRRVEVLDSLLIHIVVGTVVGARLGHTLFYEPMDYLTDPLRILYIWEGGLASHGGFTGVIIALLLFCRRHRDIPFFWLVDRITIPAMLTAGFIRVGNLFNSEIIGRPTDVDWAIVFKKIDDVPRHPSQLYEAAGYLTICAILYGLYRAAGRKPREGMLFGVALILGYGFRLFIETYKENQVAFEEGLVLNMGQMLSIPFILFGVFLLCGGQRRVQLFRYGLSPEAGGIAPAESQAATAGETAPARTRRERAKHRAKKRKR